MTDTTARQIREALGQHNDEDQPVVVLVRNLVNEIERLRAEGKRGDVLRTWLAEIERARTDREKLWDVLCTWAEQSIKEHEAGHLMSIAESVHGAATLRDVLRYMGKLESECKV